MSNNDLEIIRDYTDAGFRTFPLWGADANGVCECGDPDCKALLKHPRVSSWQHSPCWSDEQLDNMLEYTVTTGFGVCLDEHLVLDIDPRNGGDESYDRLVADTGIDFEALSGFAVRTGGNGRHIYFNRPKASLRTHLDNYPGIDFKGSGYVVGCGSLHASGAFYEREKGFPDSLTDAPAKMLEMLAQRSHHRAKVDGHYLDVTEGQLADYLAVIDNSCTYDQWVAIGMALHHTTNGVGFALWDDWSSKSDKYPGGSTLERHWHSFGKSANPVTLGTLIHYAEDAGYQMPVTFTATEEAPTEDGPFSTDTVDLLRPPGFVGQVAAFISGQCRFPREHLSAVAAIIAVGNVCGLRYTDDIDGATANMFAFGVAASGTGKEAVQQAMAEVHRAAGIQGAMHGSIKSEQEIIRNLIRHQAALFIVDEMGILLAKITNAQKRGGAVYLDGVIGILMSAYSKADGFMLLTGDTKEQVRVELASELAQCRRNVGEGEDKGGALARRIPQLQSALDNLDSGLERPFLSLMGFTTNVTFDSLVTFEQATNGFIGRSLLVIERETNPKRKKGFRKVAMDSRMKALLQNLYSPGEFDMQGSRRVEYYGERVKIPTEKKAAAMLDSVADWAEEYAEQHKSHTGLEAIVRRSYELVAKVSLILAVPEGMRTTEHVRYAFAIVKRDLGDKIRLAHGNMMSERKDSESQGTALQARILNLIDQEHGETIAVIHNRNRQFSKADISTTLEVMERIGAIRKVDVKHAGNGKITPKFFAC